MDRSTALLLARMKEQYERWKAAPLLTSREFARFLRAVGRAATVIGRPDIAAEAERLSRRVNSGKEKEWTAEEALAEIAPLLRCFYEEKETPFPLPLIKSEQESEATILLCGNDPLFFTYLCHALDAAPWRLLTAPSLEQAAASIICLSPDCLVVSLSEEDGEPSALARLLENAGRHPYLPVVVISADGRKETQLKCYELGADDVVAPMAADELFIRIRRLIEKKRKIDELVLIDELTGVYNRKYLPRVYARLRSDLERSGTPSCLALLDLDHFKQINDRFGHLAGDAVLKKLADVLLQHTCGLDTVIRFGGEEFIVWLAKTSKREARAVLERLRHQFEGEEIVADGFRLSCTFSAGLVECDQADESLDHWLRLADAALYEAKKKGGNRIEEAGAPSAPHDDGQERSQRRRTSGRRWAVAIVDDDELARAVIADLVRKLAAEQQREVDIEEFGDGLSFLQSPLYRGGRRFIVILDRVMPKMDGLEVLERLRQERKRCKVMMLTSRHDEREIAHALERGVDEYVTKPFKWLELEARLRRLLRGLDS
ncbi:diguanylate cyclase [Geobacillus sp. C56-T2]|uniref:diguanylate cyclase n=1 Tax=Geobacillus sp. C56-T2 TaxID=600773 RepID=UPI0011A934BC|nr:diguanylate cyclase [Geobacillus sp. C56-T2]NNV05183.1 diguanylate cyclase [Geobacillus sp. MMMUD3]TWG29899.1 response regulator receiver modulated diguanylate cyclase [Geobacillus sp. C56-T2]